MEETTPLHRFSLAIRQALPTLLTLAALVLALLGQRRFDVSDSATVPGGLLLFGAGALCLLLARLSLRPAADSETDISERDMVAAGTQPQRHLDRRWLLSLLGGGVGVAVVLGLWRLSSTGEESAYTGYILGWILASLLAAAPWFVPERGSSWRAESRAWLSANRWELLALTLITLLAVWLRFYQLAEAPSSISGDEGSMGLEVYRIFAGELRNPFTLASALTIPSMVPFVLAIPMHLFGATIGPLRIPGALFGTLAIPALWALARPIAGRRVALVAALFLATFPMQLHYSRVAVNVVWDTFFFTGTLALFWWGMQSHVRAMWPFALAGLVGGFGQYSYTGSRLLPLLLLLFLLYLAVAELAWLKSKVRGLLLMALVFSVVAAPLYLFAALHPDDFNARINQVGILQNGWLEEEATIRGEEKLPILWDQFRRALFGFAFFDDRTSSWRTDTPLAPPLLSLGLFLGLIITLRHWRNPAVVLLHAWFWSIILSAGMLTVNPPTSNRLTGLTPVVSLFAALGWQGMARALAQAYSPAKQLMTQRLLLALATALVSLAGVRAHEAYLEDNLFGGREAQIATLIGRQLVASPSDTTLVMLTAPRLYSDISPLAFLAPTYRRLDYTEPLTAPPPDPSDGRGDILFILLPDRVSEAAYIQQAFPGTEIREVRAEDEERTLLYYEIRVER